MTPDERRARTEHVASMAEQGILVEPPEDREEWLREHGRASGLEAARSEHDGSARGPSRRTA